jgi:predicted transcriptional regulator of viral defense system
MNIKTFVKQIDVPVFTVEQARRVLPPFERATLAIQLSRWVARQEILRFKRGVYMVAGEVVDEMVVVGLLYPSSYISLESALNMHGIIPDVPGQVTSIVTGRPRKYVTHLGTYTFSKVVPRLYFGFELVLDPNSGLSYARATAEKALLDYVYVRRVRDLHDARIAWDRLDNLTLIEMSLPYPAWVQKEVKKYV